MFVSLLRIILVDGLWAVPIKQLPGCSFLLEADLNDQRILGRVTMVFDLIEDCAQLIIGQYFGLTVFGHRLST